MQAAQMLLFVFMFAVSGGNVKQSPVGPSSVAAFHYSVSVDTDWTTSDRINESGRWGRVGGGGVWWLAGGHLRPRPPYKLQLKEGHR